RRDVEAAKQAFIIKKTRTVIYADNHLPDSAGLRGGCDGDILKSGLRIGKCGRRGRQQRLGKHVAQGDGDDFFRRSRTLIVEEDKDYAPFLIYQCDVVIDAFAVEVCGQRRASEDALFFNTVDAVADGMELEILGRRFQRE